MHQLCDALNTFASDGGAGVGAGDAGGVRAEMLYLRERRETDEGGAGTRHARDARRVEAYREYNAPVAESMPGGGEYGGRDHGDYYGNRCEDPSGASDDEVEYTSDLVIWPECWTHLIDSISPAVDAGSGKRRLHQTAIWWLSVDNNNGRFKSWDRNDVLHLHQSEYARRFLAKNGAKHVLPMTEYIPASVKADGDGSEGGEAASVITGEGRDLDALYNPLKGMHYTDEIIRRSGRGRDPVRFTPIGGDKDGRRLSPEEVSSLLSRAKLYVDFGPHPGMDRLPREAALAGCLVITNAEGAAGYEEDVPVPADYKLRKFDAERVHRLLRGGLKEFEEKTKEFDVYRRWIRGQKEMMRNCVGSFLKEVVQKRAAKR